MAAIYVPTYGLVAASILHCLLENRGYNYSVLINTDATDIIHTGGRTGILRTAKARNRAQVRDGIFIGSRFKTTGGLITMMVALTRFNRHHREQGLALTADTDLNVSVANRLYVPFEADVTRSVILESGRAQSVFRSGPLADTIAARAKAARIEPPTLRYQSLRNYALYAGLKFNPDHDVAGHTPRTRIDYLAHCLPETVLHELGTQTQNEIHENALAKFLQPRDSNKLTEAVQQGTAADMVTNVCTSNLMDPDDNDVWCSLGLAACFTCPNGYRTQDHIPGLLAVIEFTEQIRAVNPDEWVNGEAGLLHAYARKTLDLFPAQAVEAGRHHPDHGNLVTIVAHLYTEFRVA